jgi:NHS family xanthosine MFS transporter
MLMTNGIGAFLGTYISGRVVDYFTTAGPIVNGKVQLVRDWHSIWLTFAGYALVLGVVFPFVFRYKHDATDGVAHL